MDFKKILVSVREKRFNRINKCENKYSITYRHSNIEYDESEIINLIERDYVMRNGLPTESVLEIGIDSIEVG